MSDSAVLLGEGIRAEKLGMHERALAAYQEAAGDQADAAVRSEALRRQADVFRVRCDWDAAIGAAREAQRVAAEASLEICFAEALNSEASVCLARGDLDGAQPLLERMVAVTTDVRLRGIGLQNLGSVHAQQQNLDAAEQAFAESYACFRACGYERGQAIALNNQGRAALDRGDVARAREVLQEAVVAARNVGDEELIALMNTNLGEAALATSDFNRASDLVCTALGHFRESDNRWREVECLRLLGTINERRGHRSEAVRCLERGLELARLIGARLEVAAIGAQLARLQLPSPDA